METQTIEQLDIVIKAKVDEAMKSVETLVKNIKSKLSEATQSINNLSNGTRNFATTTSSSMNNTNAQYDRLKNTIKSTTAQQELMIRKIRDLEATLNDVNLSSKLSPNETLEMQAELEKLINKYNQLANAERNVGNEAEKSSNRSKKAFNGLWSVIKKGTLLTLGVRSVFSFLRQGMSSAISVNEELASKQEVVRNAIGQIFVPIMMKAYDVVQYLVAGIGLLIKAFTGIDVFAKLTTKNLNNTNKSAKALNKTLSGIDDIDTLSSSSGSLSGGIGSDLKALNEFQDKLKKVQEKFEEWGIFEKVKKIKDFVSTYIMPCLNWFLDHPTALATFFGIVISGKLLGSISALLGSATAGTGLLGLVGSLSTLVGLVSGGAIVIEILYLYNSAKKTGDQLVGIYENGEKYTEHWGEDVDTNNYSDVKDMTNALNVNFKNWKENMSSIASAFISMINPKYNKELVGYYKDLLTRVQKTIPLTKELLENTELTDEEYKEIRDDLRETRNYLKEQLKVLDENSEEYKETEEVLELTKGLIKEINTNHLPETQEGYNKIIDSNKKWFDKAEETKNEIFKTTGEVNKGLKPALDGVEKTDISTPFANCMEKVKGTLTLLKDNLKPKLKEIFDKDYNIKVGATTKNLSSALSTAFTKVVNGISGIFGGLSEVLSSGGIKDIASGIANWGKNALKKIGLFANGNVATSPTLGIFGEYANAKSNPEITAPQSILRQTFRDELKNNSNNGSFERLTINLGAEAIFDEFIDYVNNKYSNGVQVFKEA